MTVATLGEATGCIRDLYKVAHVYLSETMNFITRGVVNFCITHIKGTVLMSLLPSIRYPFSAVEFLSIYTGRFVSVIVKRWGLTFAEGLGNPLSGVCCHKTVSQHTILGWIH